MHDVDQLLNEDELEELDRFLLERIPEDVDTRDRDEGVIMVSELDGLLTAVVSGPVMVPPSRWIPAVWGEFEPEWETQEEAERVLRLMMRHMNGIAGTLMESPDEFEPMFELHEVNGKRYTVVDEWCEGYVRGIRLAPDAWKVDDLEMRALLTPILAFTSATGWSGHEVDETESENIRRNIVPNVREIHAYWLERREDIPTRPQPVRREGPRVGRNDPCPCGSGKKYKKCCLN